MSPYVKIILTATFTWIFCYPLAAQINFEKYFDGSDPFFDLESYEEVNFQWNMPGKIQAQLNEGLNNLRDEKIALSKGNFDEVYKLDTTLWVNYYYRAIAEKKLYQFEESKKDLFTAARLNPSLAEAYLELGKIYQYQRDADKSSKYYQKAIKVNDKFEQAYYSLGNLELAIGNTRAALRQYQKCNDVNPKFPNAYMAQGILKFKAKKNDDKSLPLFNQALAADSTFSETFFWRGLVYLNLDQPQKCLNDWNRFLRVNPGNPMVLMMRGYLQIEMNNFDAAFTDLRKALLTHDVDENKFKGAQTLLDKKLDLQNLARYIMRNGYGLQEESFKYLKEGFCLLLADRFVAALNAMKRSEKIEPSPTIYYLEALTYERLNRHDSAFDYYCYALRQDKDIFDAHKKRGLYYYQLKSWQKAYYDFNEMLRLQPETYATYRLRGLVRSNEKDFKGAVEDLTKFIATDSSDFEALRTRAFCYSELGEKKLANEDVRRLIYIEPNNWQLYQDAGNNYLNMGDTTNALNVYRSYEEKNPWSLIPRLALAKIYIGLKNWEEARSEVNAMIMRLNEEHLTHDKMSIGITYLDGLIDFHKGSYESAIKKFTYILNTFKDGPNYDDVRYYRAKAFQQSGQINNALSDIKKLKATGYFPANALYEELIKREQNK